LLSSNSELEPTAVTPSTTMDSVHRLLFFSLEDWDQVWRRNQFICSELFARYPNLQILWVSPPYDFSHAPTHIDPRVLRLSVNPPLPKMSLFKPLKLLPNVIGKQVNNYSMRSQIEGAVKKLGWVDFDVWINDQKARNYFPKNGVKKLLYDVTDDWTQFEQPERVKNAVIADDQWMLQHADEVIVCSEWLYKKNAANRSVHLIANGVDGHRYSPDALLKLDSPPVLAKLQSKVAGYVGTLHSERLDLNLIAEVASLLPAVEFVFIGPNCLSAQQTAALTTHANVKILGPIDYERLPSFIKCLDVCITPHKVSPFTESLDPLKLYEYMSTGKPIVSTPCAGFRDLPELVSVAPNSQTFAKAIEESLANRNTLEQKRIDWSSQQTWQQRVDEVAKVLGW
jgi:teichuronic acid biosynthesis glycosyltransferase TuaH